ncbi:hypothetical protein C8R47DRAFT_1162723 [Mycena vitilis]|nr:hypothetical protein C8R47DRAFT_1162723 [Mycena vitilis]
MSGSFTYVDRVPTEIWHRCWRGCSKRQLRRLSRVCHYFRHLCLPLLFQDQTFSPPDAQEIDRHNWIEVTKNLHRTSLRLKRLAASEHVSSVRNWQFRGSTELDLTETLPHIRNIHLLLENYYKVVRTFSATLGVYHQLHSLSLDAVFIDENFRETLSSLPRLEDLDLNHCRILPSDQVLSLRKCTITGTVLKTDEDTETPLEIVSPDALHSLKLDSSAAAIAVLSHIADHILTNLTTLTISLSTRIADIFFTSVVNGCPRLQRLHVNRLSDSVVLPSHLPPSVLPLLNFFSGPLAFLQLLVPGRPVATFHVLYPITATAEEILGAIASITQSSAVPRVLDLRIRIAGTHEVFAALTERLPALQRLDLELEQPARFWPPLAVPPPPDDDDADVAEFQEEEVDRRTPELSDDDDAQSTSSRISSTYSWDKHASVQLPSPVEPGYMYTRRGLRAPPPSDAAPRPDDEDITLFPGPIHSLTTGLLTLPASLQILRFAQPAGYGASVFGLEDQHRALLRLGARYPALREIAFTRKNSSAWTREGMVWSLKSGTAKVVAL